MIFGERQREQNIWTVSSVLSTPALQLDGLMVVQMENNLIKHINKETWTFGLTAKLIVKYSTEQTQR